MNTKYLTAMGLWKMHEYARSKVDDIEHALAELLDVSKEGSGCYYGHLSDALYDGGTLDDAIKRLDIELSINLEDTPALDTAAQS